jgi:hypothetical protein
MDLKKYKAFLNEQELPNFSDVDKEILQFMADNVELIEVGDYVDEIANKLGNRAYFTTYHSEGLDFLQRAGGLKALGYILDKEREYSGEVSGETIDNLTEENYSPLANLYAFFKVEELILASDVYAQKIARNEEEMDQQDIDDLGEELNFLAS